MSIFDLVTAQNITVYYRPFIEDREPYLGEELWPNTKQLGLRLAHIKAARGLPVVIKASAFDVQAIPRLRKGFTKNEMEMPYFKESMYVDEVTRQELNMVVQTGNAAYIDLVLSKIYDDPATLIDAARARREMMRMMLLTTGTVAYDSNGQSVEYDYGVPAENKVTVTTSWSDPTADIIGDINTNLDLIEDATGVRPTRGVVNKTTWQWILKNNAIRILVNPVLTTITSATAIISPAQVSAILLQYCNVEIVVNSKKFITDDKTTVKYIPDGTAVFFPGGLLGNTVFGTTPQESDLMTGSAVNVQIVDTGVSVTTAKHHDPVNVETIVAMICLPSFPEADQLLIMDVNP